MSQLILVTEGISVITNYVNLNNDIMDKSAELESFKDDRVIDMIQNNNRLSEEEKEEKLSRAIRNDVDRIFNEIIKRNAEASSAEVKSLYLFKRDNGIHNNDNIVLLHSNTYAGFVAANVNKKLLIHYNIAVGNQIRLDCLISHRDRNASVKINDDSDEATVITGLEILENRFERYNQELYSHKYACISGGYKIVCVAALQYALEQGIMPFLNHEDANFLVFLGRVW